MNPKFDVILGCDLLTKVKTKQRWNGRYWDIQLGQARYKARVDIADEESRNCGFVERRGNEDWSHKREEILRAFDDCFYHKGQRLSATGRVRHRIELTDSYPVYLKPRRYPHAVREEIQEQIKELRQQGIIRASKSPYCSPLWIVPKKLLPGEKTQRHRLVVDYRALNKKTKAEWYPMPRIEDMLDRMKGASVFSIIDLKAGYHQIRMHDDDVAKTAFSFERGHYEFVRMPFGLKNAPMTFQRLMDEFLEGLRTTSTQVYMDDVIVFSPSAEKHSEDLKAFFTRLREFGLKASEEKSNLFQRKVKFMGYVVSQKGAQTDEDKVAAIDAMPVPQDVKQVRQFLGMVGYYRRFVRNFAGLTEPLTQTLKKGRKFEVTKELEDCVLSCKQALKAAPALRFPDLNAPFIITTDASATALGAVIAQKQGELEWPVAFASRKLTDPETRYSAIERELLGIVWAISQFRPYIFGREFVIRTDHKPLVWVGGLKESSARVTKWKETLAGYTFRVEHIKGVENCVADVLSRHVNILETQVPEKGAFAGPYQQDCLESGSNPPSVERADTSVDGTEMLPGPSTENRVEPSHLLPRYDGIINGKREQVHFMKHQQPSLVSRGHKYGPINVTTVCVGPGQSQSEIRKFLETVMLGRKKTYWWAETEELMSEIEDIWKKSDLRAAKQVTVAMKKVETIEAPDEQVEIIKLYHEGKTNHRGTAETLTHLQRRYFWLSMYESIRQFIGQCEVCNRSKYGRNPVRPKRMKSETPHNVNEVLEIDLFAVDGQKYLTTIDRLSRLAAAWPILDKEAATIVQAIAQHFSLMDVPKRLVMDNGREFKNQNLLEYLRSLGVEPYFITPEHPKSHGAVERLHNTLVEHLTLFREGRGLVGIRAMAAAILAYNSSIHTALGATPFEVHRGLVDSREIREANEVEKTRRTKYYNRYRAEELTGKFQIGDKVFHLNRQRRRKLDPKWKGPYVIVGFLSRGRVRLKAAAAGLSNLMVRHVEELRRPAATKR